MASVNKWIGIGNLGADVEVRSFQSGGKVANFRIACSESWKDRDGNKQERTEWITVAIFSEGLIGVAERYLRKGSKVYVEGQLRTRKWQAQDGSDRYATEVVLQGPGAKLVLLDSAQGGQRDPGGERSRGRGDAGSSGGGWGDSGGASFADDLDDEIPGWG